MKENIISEILIKNKNLSNETKSKLHLMNITQLTYLLNQVLAPKKFNFLPYLVIAALIGFFVAILLTQNINNF
jgi:hypothetical protein